MHSCKKPFRRPKSEDGSLATFGNSSEAFLLLVDVNSKVPPHLHSWAFKNSSDAQTKIDTNADLNCWSVYLRLPDDEDPHPIERFVPLC